MRKLGMTFIVVFGFGFTGIAQEYDDMYFNSSDRKKAKEERKEELKAELEYPMQYPQTNYYGDNYSQQEVDPALIDQYRQQDEEKRLQYLSPYNSANNQVNANFGEQPLDFQYSGQYYQDDLYYQDEYQGNPTVINNYYGNVNPGWNGGFGGGWGNPYGWGNGWGMSVGFGLGWNSWGFYDPFWNSWYDPWFGWGGWGSGFYRPWGTWGWGGWGWNSPWRYGGFYDNGWCYIAPNTPSKQPREINRGPRMDRGGNLVNSNGQNRPLQNVAQNTNGRTPLRTQSDYQSQVRGDGASTTRPYTSGGVVNYTNRNPRIDGNQAGTRPTYDRNGGNTNQNASGTRTYQARPSRNAGAPQYQNRVYQRPGNTINQNPTYTPPNGRVINRGNESQQQSGQTFRMPNTHQRSNLPSPNVRQNSSGGSRSSGANVNRSSGSSGSRSSGGSSGGGRSGGSSGGSSGGGGGSRGGGGRGGN